MALILQDIARALAQQGDQGPWQKARLAAWESLQAMGAPWSHSENFFWIPASVLNSLQLAPAQSAQTVPDGASLDGWDATLRNDKDFAALLPAILCATPHFHFLDGDNPTLEIADTDPYAFHVVHVAAQSHASIRWRTEGPSPFASSRLHVDADADSEVEIITHTQSSFPALSHVNLKLGDRVQLRWLDFDESQALRRLSAQVLLAGEESLFFFHALSLSAGQAQSHRRLRVLHQGTRSQSTQWARHVLLGQSQASCDTWVEITPGTTGCVANQLVNSLLLSTEAKASARPDLVIHNDEVEASHGATCGDLDAAQLFYLQSRGLDPVEARRLLVASFARTLVTAHGESPAALNLRKQIDAALQRSFS